MATIKATTIDALPDLDASAIGDDLNILIQNDADITKTNKTTLKNLKTYFGTGGSGGSGGAGEGSGTTTEYVINDFNLGEYALTGELGNFTLESGSVCEYHSEKYETKCDQEIYAHFDVALTSTTDMWSYQDSYIAIELQMRNDDNQDVTDWKWYPVCRKPLSDCGTKGLKSIDFHMALRSGMTFRATVFGGANNGGFGLVKDGTVCHLVVTSLNAVPLNDYSTYLYLSKTTASKTLTSKEDGDFAVGVWALGKSSVADTMNIVISTGGGSSPIGRVATYKKGTDIGEVFLGSFYFPKDTKVTIGLAHSSTAETTTPVYVRLSFIKDNIGSKSISSIKSSTSGSANSLKITSSGDFALTGVTYGSQYDTVEFHSDHSSTGVTEFTGELDASVIESQSVSTTKLGTRTLYYQDVFTNFCNGTLTSAKNETITSIRFNKSYNKVVDNAFYNCTALTAVDFASSRTSSIGKQAFRGCTKLKTVDMSNASNLTSISSLAFYGCNSLTTVNFNSSTQVIDSQAFQQCSSLVDVRLPIGVQTLNANAFSTCSGLKNFYIPYNVKSVANTILASNNNFVKKNGGQLYVVIPNGAATWSDGMDYIRGNATVLGTLYKVPGFLNSENKLKFIVALPNWEKFTFDDGGKTKYLEVTYDSATATPVPELVAIS